MKTKLLIILLLLLSTLAVYYQVKDFEFLYFDDNEFVTENTDVREGLTIKGIQWAFTTTLSTLWHPLAWISHMLDCSIYGLNPAGHHITNLLFHLANTILLFYALHRMTGALWRSAFVAALFALHPLHVESVAWIAERKDVLSSFFWILTMLLYVRYVEETNIRRYLLVLLTVTLGLLSKPMVVTLPFSLLLLDYWPLGRFGFNGNKRDKGKSVTSLIIRLIVEKTPFFLLSAAVSISLIFIMKKTDALYDGTAVPYDVRLGQAMIIYVQYIVKMIWPANLSVYYPFPLTVPKLQLIASAMILLYASFQAVTLSKRYPYVLTGFLWYLGTLVPVIGIVKAGTHTMNDRYTYIPLIGIFIIIAWGVPDLLSKWRRRKEIATLLSITAILLSMVTTWFQLGHWKNTITLFEHAVKVTKNNSLAHFTLGIALAKEGDIKGAMRHYTDSIRIKPGDPKPHLNMGNLLMKTGRFDDAAKFYSKAVELDPGYSQARNNLGLILLNRGRFDEAIAHFKKAIEHDPRHSGALNNLGVAMLDTGNMDKAEEYFKRLLKISPDHIEARINLGLVFAEKGLYAEAVKQYRTVLSYNPAYTEAYIDMAMAFEKKGDYDEAVKNYKKALALDPGNAEIYYFTGNVLYNSGNKDEATEYFLKALHLNPDFARARTALGIIFVENGDVDKAIHHFSLSLQNNPKAPSAHFNLALAYEMKEMKEEAIEAYEEALRLRPEWALAKEKLGELLKKRY